MIRKVSAAVLGVVLTVLCLGLLMAQAPQGNIFQGLPWPRGQIPGAIGSVAPCAGCLGEFNVTTVSSVTPVSLTTGVVANVTSKALTAGGWDCWGNIGRTFGASTNVAQLIGSINTVSATLGATPTYGVLSYGTAGLVPISPITQTVPMQHITSDGAGVTAFLVVEDSFTVSTDSAYGFLACQRAN